MTARHILGFFLFLAPWAHQDAGRSDAQLYAAEDQILRLEARGDALGALDRALALLKESAAESNAAKDEGAKTRAASHAEFVASVAARLARATTSYAKVGKALDGIDRAACLPPLAAALARLRAECALRTGDGATIQRITSELGFLGDWMVIGPFDNERGGGFTRADEPEKGWAPDLVARGKERDVRWRPIPVKNPPMGLVELGAMYRPNQQALAYLRTTVSLTNAETLVFWCSSAEALRFWVDGKLLFEANVRRAAHFDQNAVVARLQPGVHELLVKVCTQEKGWRFACRATRLDGTPVALDCGAKREAKSVEDPGGAVEPAIPRRGALEYFAKKAGFRLPEESGPAGENEAAAAGFAADPNERAAAAYRYATLLRDRHAEDDTSHPDRAPARLATELDAKNAIYQVLLARSLRQETQVAEERELNPTRRALEKAFELDPENAEACLELAEHYTQVLPIQDSARLWLGRALRIAPDSLVARVRRSSRFASLDLPREAEREDRDAAKLSGAEGFAPLQEKLGFVEFQRGRSVEAEKHLRAAAAADRFSDGTGTSLRSLLLQEGRANEVLALLDEASRLQPFETWVPIEKARILTGQGQKDDARAAFAQALAICPEDAKIHARLANVLSLFSDNEAAVLALEEAVRLDPKDRTSRRYLEFLRSNVKPFEDPFRIDAAAYLPKAPPSVAAADEPFEVALHQIAYKLNPDGTTQRYEHIVATVLNEEGAKRLDSYGVSYDPGDEQVRIRRARVIRKDGKIDDAPAPPGTPWVKFPPLSIGDTIDLEARVDTIRVGIFGNYFGTRHVFHGMSFASTRRSEQIYLAPSDRPLHFSKRNGAPDAETSVDAESKMTTYRFAMDGLKKLQVESSMPDPIEFSPSVSVSTYGSWDEFTAWWWNLIEKECQSSPAIREKVMELVKGKTTREEKMRAVYDFVVSDVRYNAWEFGVHGYRPYNAATIFDRRYGDCKDKAILIKTMLQDAGIEAYPVLIFADERRPKEDMSLPMVGLFNHCIAFVPAGDGMEPLFLDGTARSHPMGVLPDMDHGARVVVVKGGKPVLMDTGYPSPDANLDAMELRFDVAADGSAKGSLVMRPKGNYDVRVREFYGSELGAQKENLERFLSPHLGRTKVLELETSKLDDLGQPVELKAQIEVEKLAKAKGSDLALPVSIFKRKLLSNADEPKRTYDLLLGSPEADDFAIVYRLPESLSVRSAPADESRDGAFGSCAITVKQDGREITVRARSTTKKPRVTPEEYGAFRQFARELDEAQDREIVLKGGQ